MVIRETVCKVDRFDRAQTYTTTPAGEFGWAIKKTGAGSPTYLNVSGGGAAIALSNTSEAQVVALYQSDVLPFPLAKLQSVSFVLKVSSVDAVTTLVAGVASAQNDTADSVATHAWFRMEGSASTSAVVAETDDGVVDNDDKSTGTSLSSTYKKFLIDFTNGLSDVRFYVDGARVAESTTFNMSNASSSQNMQLIVQLQKASGTGTPAITIKRSEVQYNIADGA